jgi:AcrR family transcriptional regulator
MTRGPNSKLRALRGCGATAGFIPRPAGERRLMKTPAIGRRERKKEITRQALLKAAIKLFGDRGFQGTRVEDITDRVDLAKGAFYNYFDSKETLLAELILEGVELLERDYLAQLPDNNPLNGHLAELVRLYGAFYDEHPEYLLLIHQARGLLKLSEGGNERLRQVLVDLLQCLAGRLAPPNESDQWTSDECMELATVLAGGVAGYRSFKLTAGLGPASEASERATALGMAQMMDEMKRSRRAL